jgi:tripartite-type tricarboxylate transporter receptor subunit TctC
MFSDAAKVPGQVIGYRGSAPLANDLIGGAIPVAVDTLDTLLPLHEAGRLRILAVSSAKRSPLAPSLPTFAESGFDVVATGWNALFAPSTMPAARVTQIGNAVRDVMAQKEVRQRFTDAKMLPVSSTPEQTARMLKAYREQWEPVVRRSGFKP